MADPVYPAATHDIGARRRELARRRLGQRRGDKPSSS